MARAIAAARSGLVKASVADTLAVLGEVVLPTLAKGVIIRRPKVVAVAERLELDRRAVRRLQKLRAKYGDGPVLLAIPGRSEAVLLSPDHLRRVLEGTPRPFSPASAEKRAALAHFEPNVSLISRGPERTERRAFNEAVLDSGCPVHSLADKFLEIVDEEAQELLGQSGDELDWDGFAAAWHRLVRRVVLGNAARDDHELTEMLARLRGAANWAFLHPGRKALLRRFHERLAAHLARAERGSLAQRIGELPKTETTAPSDQVAHYLFAFDAGGIATYRALALLASHARQGQRAREEIAAGGSRGKDLAFLRACVLDGLRLWPTTPAILRETTEDVPWDGALMPKNTNILVFTPYFHRDGETLPYADRFTPELWLGERPGSRSPLVPFSDGPAICPARDLVTMLASAMIAALLARRAISPRPPTRLDPDRPLPTTLDHFSLRFRMAPT